MEEKNNEVIDTDTKDYVNDYEKKIITAIESYVTPTRLSILMGISEIELRSSILDNPKLLQDVRALLFDMQIDLTNRVIGGSLDKKNTTDFLFAQAEKHFDTWSRFIATDIDISSDILLIKNAIKGGIGNDNNFWLGATQDLKRGFRLAMTETEMYIRMFFDIVEGRQFENGIQYKLMFDELKKIQTNDTNILIINIAPRLGKSTTLYAWATKMLMTIPSFNVVYTSYGEMVLTLIRKRIDMAFDKFLDKEKTKPNPFYLIYENAKMEGFSKESDFLTDINSAFFSATMLGGVTGRGASVRGKPNGVMIIDDPHSANDVGTVRIETTWQKFLDTWLSRKGVNPIVLIMQRLCAGDMTDKMLEMYKDSELRVKVLTLPIEMTEEVAEYIAKQQAKYPNIEFINPSNFMEIGDTLLEKHKIEEYKQTFPEAVFKTQYLQIPTTHEGAIFKSKMFYNQAYSIMPILVNDNQNGYVNVFGKKRALIDDEWQEENVDFEGVFLLHIDTTSGNTETTGNDVDNCVWSICVAGLKDRKYRDNAYGAVLFQYGLNSKEASDVRMQSISIELIKKIHALYNKGFDKKINPHIIVAIETHSQGGGLASYLRGLKLHNVVVESYSRQNFGNKKDRFLRGSGFYEDRIFWYQNSEKPLFSIDGERNIDWFYVSRQQHLMVDGERTTIHDDFVEAPCDLGNLWLSNDGRDKIYQSYYKLRSENVKR